MRWTVFCRVVDNFGDIGFAWRLAADLGSRGEAVFLAVDDASALNWLAPRGAAGVRVGSWPEGAVAEAEVWLETFGCGLPESGSIAPSPRLHINVEHLSAEGYIARSHGLASPRFDAAGQARPPVWFFYPGFDDRSGGLVRERNLLAERERFGDGHDWLRAHGIERRSGERCVSLFCYRNPALGRWLDLMGATPTLLLLTPGFATEQARALLGPGLQRGQLRAVLLPALDQGEFDRLLWSCDLNFVRGEDSLVRALWAGVPFVWQLYPQDDGAHAAKLDAFMDRFLDGATAPLAGLRSLFADWNGLAPGLGSTSIGSVLDDEAWAGQCRRFRDRCSAQPDLSIALIDFAASRR